MDCDWQLRGQGAANVVFGYCGDDPQLRGYVLRVRKPSAHVASDVDRVLWDGILRSASGMYDINYELEYIANIMAPLLGHEYVFPGVPVPVPPDLQEELGSDAVSHLPALLLPDHTTFHSNAIPGYNGVGPAICLEIKPKWGLDPRSPHVTQGIMVASATAVSAPAGPSLESPVGCRQASAHSAGIHDSDPRRQYPRFMLHMLYKHIKVGVPVSSYNPLDLFSGELKRMEGALRCLIRSPSNNLTVFKDGIKIYGSTCMKGNSAGGRDVASRQPRDGTRPQQQQPSLPPPPPQQSDHHYHQQQPHQRQQQQQQQQLHYHHHQQECQHHGSHRMTTLERLVADLQGFVDEDQDHYDGGNVNKNNNGKDTIAPVCDSNVHQQSLLIPTHSAAPVPASGVAAPVATTKVKATAAATIKTTTIATPAAAAVATTTARAVVAAAAVTAAPGRVPPASTQDDDLGFEVLEVLVRLTALALQQEGLLGRLLTVQALDRIGPEGALRLYNQLLGELQTDAATAASGTTATAGAGAEKRVVSGICDSSNSKGGCEGNSGASGGRLEETAGPSPPPPPPPPLPRSELLAALRHYIMSATAKDCGIMVTLQRAFPAAVMLASEPAVPAVPALPAAPLVAGVQMEAVEGGGNCDVQCNGSTRQQLLLLQALPEEPLGSAAANSSAAETVAAAGGGSAGAGAADEESAQQPRVRVLVEPQSGAAYLVKAAFVDLDVKAVAKIPQHVELERALVTCAEENRGLLLAMAQQAIWTA